MGLFILLLFLIFTNHTPLQGVFRNIFLNLRISKNTKALMREQEKPINLAVGQQIVNKKYKIYDVIGEGSFTKSYTIFFIKRNAQIHRAIKFQKQKCKYPQIPTQVAVLKSIFKKKKQTSPIYEIGFPKIYEYGNENQLNYIVMDIYGPNLAQLMKLCTGKFSLKTTLLIGLQIIDRLELLHSVNFTYIDFKPQNFLIGLEKLSPYIFMIDFGKCISYRSSKTNHHVPYKNFNYQYDPMFSSINSHLGIHPSRRDDIESFIYLLVYLHRGKLPWKKVQGKSKKERQAQIFELKKRITSESLIKEMPIELCDILEYAKSLNYFEKPDYNYLRKNLLVAFQNLPHDPQFSPATVLFDWHLREDVDYQLYREVPGIKLLKKDYEQQGEQQQYSNNQEEDLSLI